MYFGSSYSETVDGMGNRTFTVKHKTLGDMGLSRLVVTATIKNELAGGVMPCGRFGANAAWLRLAVITYNVLTALKRLALPPELLTARPKRLRFLIFNTPGKLVHHARRTLLRLVRTWNRFGNWQHALVLLPLPAS